MKINNLIKIRATFIVLLVAILLSLAACNLKLENKLTLDLAPIPDDDYIEEYTNSLDDYQAHRRQVYQQQIVLEQQELNQNIISLKQQINQQENSPLQKELAQLLQQKILVDQQVSVLIKADSNNWEEAGFIADRELANLQQEYDILKKAVTRSQKLKLDPLLPIYKNPKLKIERV